MLRLLRLAALAMSCQGSGTEGSRLLGPRGRGLGVAAVWGGGFGVGVLRGWDGKGGGWVWRVGWVWYRFLYIYIYIREGVVYFPERG